jgi:CHAT domain-containing protein
VKLVLQELEYYRESASHNLPRIWWIGIGVASFLPFHAAGYHSAGSTENTHSRAICSYTPTIKILTYARERALVTAKFSNDKPKLLVVTMPATPGQELLPGVTKEMSEIQMAVKTRFSVQSLIQPNAKQVLEQLKHCDMIHLPAMEYWTSQIIPTGNSYLVLQDLQNSQSTPKPDKLTVRQVSEVSLKQARQDCLLYLSACSTAENRALELSDKVIHLASGFQVAGFGHVIGSMGPSNDIICVEVAKGFYEQLKTHYNVQDSSKAIAAALHNSAMEVRSNLRRQPLFWGSIFT